MRLWHKDLIESLPRQQLISQWRECCCIARNIEVNNTPNHLLVNKILIYPREHFYFYTCLVCKEMEKRGYKCNFENFTKWFEVPKKCELTFDNLFVGWHNERYLKQCYYNLQEKYDCGGIKVEEWSKVYNNEKIREVLS